MSQFFSAESDSDSDSELEMRYKKKMQKRHFLEDWWEKNEFSRYYSKEINREINKKKVIHDAIKKYLSPFPQKHKIPTRKQVIERFRELNKFDKEDILKDILQNIHKQEIPQLKIIYDADNTINFNKVIKTINIDKELLDEIKKYWYFLDRHPNIILNLSKKQLDDNRQLPMEVIKQIATFSFYKKRRRKKSGVRRKSKKRKSKKRRSKKSSVRRKSKKRSKKSSVRRKSTKTQSKRKSRKRRSKKSSVRRKSRKKRSKKHSKIKSKIKSRKKRSKKRSVRRKSKKRKSR